MSTNMHNPADRRIYPDRWPRYRGKQLFEVIDDKSETGEEELLSVSHITGITPRSQKTVNMFQSESLVGYKRVQVGDIAANTMWTWQGAIGVSKYAGVVSPAYNVYRQRGNYFNPRFLDLLLREPTLVDVYHSLSTGIQPSRLRLYPSDFLTIDFPVPELEEQEQIVRYLDWKSSGINRLIAARRVQIATLEEMKLASIRHALLANNDDGRDMKQTGFELLPHIPTNWDFVQVRRAYDVILGKMLQSAQKSEDETFETYLGARDVHFDGINHTDLKRMWYTESEKEKYLVREGDLLVVEGGAVGNSAIAHISDGESIYVQNSVHIVRPKSAESLNRFLRYWLMYLAKTGYISSICNVATIAHYTKDKLSSTPMPLPPINEQAAIVNHLDAVCKKIDKFIALENEAIHELQLLRTRLISNAINGTYSVINVTVPEFDYVADTADDSSGDEIIEDSED